MASASLFDTQALAGEDATARTRWARLQSLARDRCMPEIQDNLEAELRRRLR